MQLETAFTWTLLALLLLSLVAVLLILGIIAAIRHGYGKAVMGLTVVVGLFLLSFIGVSVRTMESRQEATPEYHQSMFRAEGSEAPAAPTAQTLTGEEHQIATAAESTPKASDPFSTNSATTPLTGPTPQKILYVTGNASPVEISELPGWRKNPIHEGSFQSGEWKYVLSSRQFASVEEAEAELFAALSADVQRFLTARHPEYQPWGPSPDDLVNSKLIAEKVIETYPLKVGEFENPVYRVSWLVEYRPETDRALLTRWQPIEAERRSKLLLTVLASVTGAFGVSALWLRRRREVPAAGQSMA